MLKVVASHKWDLVYTPTHALLEKSQYKSMLNNIRSDYKYHLCEIIKARLALLIMLFFRPNTAALNVRSGSANKILLLF